LGAVLGCGPDETCERASDLPPSGDHHARDVSVHADVSEDTAEREMARFLDATYSVEDQRFIIQYTAEDGREVRVTYRILPPEI